MAWFVVDSKMGLACLGRYLQTGSGIYCANNWENFSILSKGKENEDEEEGKEKYDKENGEKEKEGKTAA